MKKYKRTKSIVFLTVMLVISSCSSSDDGLINSGGNGEFIAASIEGFAFESSRTIDATTATKIDGSQFTTLLIQGFDDDGNAIVLSISEYEGVGTYEEDFIDGPNGTVGQFSNLETVWNSAAGEGGFVRITVETDNNEETTGIFEFVGIETTNENSSRTANNGVFRVNFE